MSRIALRSSLAALFLVAAACDKVALLAPTGSTVNLSISSTSVGANGTVELIASVTEASGTPVHNGTEVTFQASVGQVSPATARTEGGVARATFRANGASGTASVTAFSGGARSTAVDVRVGSAAAETVSVRADPAAVSASGGPVTLIATIRDISGNPLPGAQVVFSSDVGNLSSSSAISDAQGEARTTLTTTREANVTASVAGRTGTVRVTVTGRPSVTISGVTPATPLVGLPLSVTVTPTTTTTGSPIQSVSVDFGDGTVRNLGAIASAQSVSHTYARADTYTITATAIDTVGERNTTSTTVTVQRAVVGVAFTSAPSVGQVGTTVPFTVAVTNSNNIPLQSVNVSFGDGKTATLPPAGGPTNNVYTAPNTYTVRATAVDQSGTVSEAIHQIVITAAPPLDVTLDVESADPQLTIECAPGTNYPKRCATTLIGNGAAVRLLAGCSSAFGGTPGACANALSYRWDFGDGSPPEVTTSRSVDHVFRQRSGAAGFVITVSVQSSTGSVGTQRLTLIVN